MKIVIDGNIGSGKTTQLNILEDLGFKVKREPIDQWPLELFYSDMERWGLTFQLVVLNTLTTEEGEIIYERSPVSAKNVFWRAMKKTDLEDRVFNNYYDVMGWGPDLYILINKSPEMCYEHIQERVQAGDGGVTLDYLKTLDGYYQDMFEELDCPKYKVDGNKPIREVHQDILKWIQNNSASG